MEQKENKNSEEGFRNKAAEFYKRDYKDTLFRMIFREKKKFAEFVQRNEWEALYRGRGVGGCDIGKCYLYEHEKRYSFYFLWQS